MRFEAFSFGFIRIDGVTYECDVGSRSQEGAEAQQSRSAMGLRPAVKRHAGDGDGG